MPIPERWIIARGYLIRHKPTGFYIPQIKPGNRRGGSLVEPTDPKEKHPRIFQSELAAKSYLTQWCKGKHICHRYFDGDVEKIEIIPQPNRIKANMEIVPVVMIPEDF